MATNRRAIGVGLTLGVAGLFSTAALSGCQGTNAEAGPTAAVSGRVLLADGKPLNTGRVVFVSREGVLPPATGEIKADGRFTLTTRNPDDGAVPGTYKLRIEPPSRAARTPATGARGPAFPVKYVDEDSSGLTVTVREGTNELGPIRLR